MAIDNAIYRDRITITPDVMAGKPVVKGTRIPVETVLAHLADSPDLKDVLAAFPRLTVEDVKACLDFATQSVRTSRRRKI